MFISHGDFLFPLHFAQYVMKHLFIWSFQNGAANPDGIIRIFMRFPVLAVFYFFGGLAASYFYLIATMLIGYAAFYYFLHRLLKINNTPVKMLASLMFMLNPIFLGNIAKLGLVQAVTMLPLSLTFMSNAFERKNVKWLLLWLVVINASFVHPFTLVVNLAVNGIFFCYLGLKHLEFLKRSVGKFLLIGLLALALNAYFILPLASLGSIDKSVLTQDLGEEKPDYTQLISVASNKDVIESLSLSKSVFIDFSFFNEGYEKIYLAGIFIFYVLLFVVYFRNQPHLNRKERNIFRLLLLCFLLLIAASTTSIKGSAEILRYVSTLPGGWMFRSPLKWQLYIPVVLFSLLAMALKHVKGKKQFVILPLFYLILISINAFIMAEAFMKLLTPRRVETLQQMQNLDLNEKNLVYIVDTTCSDVAVDQPAFFTELNVVLASNNLQVKRINREHLDYYVLQHFDYVLSCDVPLRDLQQKLENNFKQIQTYVDNKVVLFENNQKQPLVYATDSIYTLNDTKDIEHKRSFVENSLKKPFYFAINSSEMTTPTIKLYELFDHLRADNILPGYLMDNSILPTTGQGQLYLRRPKITAEVGINALTLTPTPASSDSAAKVVPFKADDQVSVYYRDPKVQPQNLIPNGSFEEGPWEDEVGDCYNFDGQPVLAMDINADESVAGQQSLELRATRHVACTNRQFNIKGNTSYVLDLNFQGDEARIAGYYLGFNDPDETAESDKLGISNQNWNSYSRVFKTPPRATQATLTLYGYPINTGVQSITRYDGIGLYEIPDVASAFFSVFPAQVSTSKPDSVSSKQLTPTRLLISVKGSKGSFYLLTKDSFHKQWQLREKNTGYVVNQHFVANNFQNGWFINADELCSRPFVCHQNSDGSFDVEFELQFGPQRWFYAGAVISMIALEVCLFFIFWDWHRLASAKLRLLKQ